MRLCQGFSNFDRNGRTGQGVIACSGGGRNHAPNLVGRGGRLRLYPHLETFGFKLLARVVFAFADDTFNFLALQKTEAFGHDGGRHNAGGKERYQRRFGNEGEIFRASEDASIKVNVGFAVF